MVTDDLDHLEAIYDAVHQDPSYDSPQGRSRKFRLAHKDGFAGVLDNGRRRPKWKRQLTLDRAHAAAGHKRGGK